MKKYQGLVIAIVVTIAFYFIKMISGVSEKNEANCYNNLYDRVESINMLALSTKYNSDIKKITQISDFNRDYISDSDNIYGTVIYLDSVEKDLFLYKNDIDKQIAALNKSIDSVRISKQVSPERLKNIEDGLKRISKNAYDNYDNIYNATHYLKEMYERLRDCEFNIEQNNQITIYNQECSDYFNFIKYQYNNLVIKMMAKKASIDQGNRSKINN